MANRPLYCTCVSWPPDQMPVLEHLISEGEEIDLRTFRALVGRPAEEVFQSLGYGRHMPVDKDWHVRFKRDPSSGIPFMVHSAIEHVFATDDEIQQVAARLAAEKHHLMVLVHPGSMVGSARQHLGRREADEARADVLWEVDAHHGPILVIDGALSDELNATDDALITASLARAREAGFTALRVWGDDGGDAPFARWNGQGDPAAGLVFDGQEAAVAALLAAGDLETHTLSRITVTGAWAGADADAGCVGSVAKVLRDTLPATICTEISDRALRMDDDPEPEVDDGYEP